MTQDKKQTLNSKVNELENRLNNLIQHYNTSISTLSNEIQNPPQHKNNQLTFVCSDFSLHCVSDLGFKALKKEFNEELKQLFKHHKIDKKGL